MAVQNAKDEVLDLDVLNHRPASCGHMLRDRVSESPSAVAYQFLRGEDMQNLTWQQAWDEVKVWAAGLVALGVETGDGWIYIIYDHKRLKVKQILMARFREEDVLAGRLVASGSLLRVLVDQAGGET